MGIPDLKPCPFCGGEAVATTNSDLDTYAAVRCTGCYIGTPHRSYGDATIEWNRRVDVDSLGIAHRFFLRRRKAKVPNGATITTVKAEARDV